MSNALTKRITDSVLAVPPLSRTGDLSLSEAENTKLIRHIEAGGIRTLLYGGNANFYHISLSGFDQVLAFLAKAAGPDTLVIPSVGPAYGTMMDQAKILRSHRYPTVMVLPQQGLTTPHGVEMGIQRFVQAAAMPVVLYIKNEGYIEPENVQRLVSSGVVSGIKYAIVRDDPAKDPYLDRLVKLVDPNLIISGIGEQPAIVHLRDYTLGGFTSGCICVAPTLSAKMLVALRNKKWDEAESIRRIFKPLEDLRNAINPIRVLHAAVQLAGIALTGPLLPLMSVVDATDHAVIGDAAKTLLAEEMKARSIRL